MNLKTLLEKYKLLELKKKEAGEAHKFIDINSAVEDLVDKYKDDVQHYFPDTKKFDYLGKPYNVALVLGDVEITENHDIVIRKYGVKHFTSKHGEQIVDGKKYTMVNMEKAMRNFHKAMENGTWYRDKDYTDRLALTYGAYVYIICLETDTDELTYLHNLFVPNKDYRQEYLNKEHKIAKSDIKVEKSKDK